MSDLIKGLLKEQQNLINDCKRGIESNKLALWSFKAELNSLQLQLKKSKSNIQENEKNHYLIVAKAKKSAKELKFIADSVHKYQVKSIIELGNSMALIQEISGGICKMLGFAETSWSWFKVPFT